MDCVALGQPKVPLLAAGLEYTIGIAEHAARITAKMKMIALENAIILNMLSATNEPFVWRSRGNFTEGCVDARLGTWVESKHDEVIRALVYTLI